MPVLNFTSYPITLRSEFGEVTYNPTGNFAWLGERDGQP